MTLTERRLHPRIATDQEAEVRSPGGRHSLRAQLLNVSMGGLRIRCDSVLRDNLTAAPETFPVEAEISFDLPQGAVSLTCRHIHTLRLSENVFELGFKTLRYHDDAEDYLEAFIAQQLARA